MEGGGLIREMRSLEEEKLHAESKRQKTSHDF